MAGLALADVIWPALDLVDSYWSWWVILVGLAIEFVVLRQFFALQTWPAVRADVLMNAASATVGMVGLGVAGLVWEFIPGWFLDKRIDDATFEVVRWASMFVLAVVINTLVEGAVLRAAFQVRFGRKRILVLAAANAVTIAMAGVELWLHPPRH